MAASSSRVNEGTVVESSPKGRFSRYNIIIREGPSKTVYKGFDHRYGTEIAWSRIKLSSGKQKTSENLVKLCKEPIILISLNHPNITKCYDYWIDEYENVVNMITEYCSSGNLEIYSKDHVQNLVGNTAIKNWCRQILNALHYLHTDSDRLVKHCDIKCGNIFVNGNTGTIKLGDFGHAKVFESARSIPSLVSDDISSFGMAVTEMITQESQLYYSKMGLNTVGLLGVIDPEIKQFLLKCIIPRPGLTAMDLLNDPFLAVGVVNTPSVSRSDAGFLNVIKNVQDQVATLLLPPQVVKEINIGCRKISIQGKMSEYLPNSVTMKLIVDGNHTVETIDFDIVVGVDNISDVMKDRNEELELFSADELTQVSEIMQELVTEVKDLYLEEIRSDNTSDEDYRGTGYRMLSSYLCCNSCNIL